MTQTATLRRLLASGDIFVAPGCFDGLSARMIAQAGFKIAYASGGAISRGAGMPDLGLFTARECADRMEQICDAVDIPVIADADTGYGNALNARRAAKHFMRAGVAAIHLEDQTFPKKCGHYDDKSIVSTHEFTQKLKAVKDVTGDELVLIARSDGLAVEGFDATIDRCHAYAEAGADVIFFEAPQTVEQIEEIGRLIETPKLINMFAGGKTPMVPLQDLKAWGYQLVIVPSDLQRAAIAAMQRTLVAIAQNGDSSALSDEMVTFKDREAIIGTDEWNELNRRFAE
ncbi:MAG: isocitrate lyase/PEP mutase family protein [Pseudomonadota bacterium]